MRLLSVPLNPEVQLNVRVPANVGFKAITTILGLPFALRSSLFSMSYRLTEDFLEETVVVSSRPTGSFCTDEQTIVLGY